jgi:Arc/MetJ-type ribon-helix-helix transcriptional regulator
MYSILQYLSSMKVKTSITLSQDLIEAIDRRSGQFRNRSEFIEEAVRAFLGQIARAEQDARDLAILNRRADELNEEAADVLAYQVPL